MTSATLEKLQAPCECGRLECVKRREVDPKLLELPPTDPNAPVRVILITRNLKTGVTKAFTNKGTVAKPKAAKAATRRKVTLDFADNFEGDMTFSVALPQGEYRLAA